MKAVIVEIKGNVAAILSEDGRISKIKNKNYTLGQELILKYNKKYIKFAATAAAALIMFATPAWAYLTPYSYVSLDINPSFEFSINRFDRVIEVKAVNDDGEKVIEEININELKNKEIKVAVKNVINELKNQGYINNDTKNGVVVAASSKNKEKTDKLATSVRLAVEEEVDNLVTKSNEIEKEIETQAIVGKNQVKNEVLDEKAAEEESKETESTNVKIEIEKASDNLVEQNTNDESELKKESEEEKLYKKQNNSKNDKFSIEVVEVSQDEVTEAKNKGVTPGKLSLVEKLESLSSDIDVNKWLDKPVKDIIKEIDKLEKQKEKENKKEDKDKDNKKEKDDKESNKKSKEKK